MAKNKYLIDEIEQKNIYTPIQSAKVRFNNSYVLKTLNSVFYQIYTQGTWNGKLLDAFKDQVNTKKLPFDEPKLKQGDLALKLYAFVVFAKKPENIAKFKESPFYSFLVTVLSGYTGMTQATDWVNFKKNAVDDDLLKNRVPFSAALKCYEIDKSIPIKINMNEVLNALFAKTSDGRYTFRTDLSNDEIAQLKEAAVEFVNYLQSLPRFKNNFDNEERKFMEGLDRERD